MQINLSSFVCNPHLLCLTLPLFNYLLVPHEVQVNFIVLISKYDSHNSHESHDLHEYQIDSQSLQHSEEEKKQDCESN